MRGGIVTIESNKVNYNGKLTMNLLQNQHSSIEITTYFPYQEYFFSEDMYYGVFTFEQTGFGMQEGKSHLVRNNDIQTSVCQWGCGFSIVGDRAQQIRFESNYYGLNTALY
jgi:hypothetical protein